MKIFIFLIILLFNLSVRCEVVNSCGSDNFKTSNNEPSTKEDCKDPEEAACKIVTVKINGNTKKFCAIIHGKYNDEDVLKEVGNLINGEVAVEGKGFMIKEKYTFSLLIGLLLLF